jgi:alpha-tubulin suppressor-like RCC1 family protein
MGSVGDELIDQPNQKDIEASMMSKSEDLETARQLLSSLLYIKDADGRSYLHTNFHLCWAKALLDRAKNLDEDSEHYIELSMAGMDQFKHARNNNVGSTNGRSTLMQRRFLLQPDKESGYTPFHIAIMKRNLAAILMFLRHATADDMSSTNRLTQRPMTLLHAAEANHGHNRTNGHKNIRNDNNLLLAIANATDHEGMTPLRLLGRLQQPELSRCRNFLRSFKPSVDRNATMRLRTRSRQSSFDINSNNNDEDIDFFSGNADLLHVDEADSEGEENGSTIDTVTYACEVVTFGRPHHCALGVVQGGSSSSSAFASPSVKDSNNQTYTHGSAFRPQRVQEFAQEIVGRPGSATAVAAATHHSLVVTKRGHLYAFGLGKGGRLGLGDDQSQQCPLPKRILGPLQRRQVVSVAAAENHSLCVTSQGDVYSWGSNRFGQLGDHSVGTSPTASCGSRSIPRRVENLKQHACVAVAAGEKHSVALSRKGEVYVWGDNTSGQLGVSRRTGIQKVQRVEALWGSSTSQGSNNSSPKITIAIAAAAQSTLVLTTGSPSSRLTNVNAIYEWGHGNHVPIRVHFETYDKAAGMKKDGSNRSTSLTSSFSRMPNPTAIACARYHNVAITSDGMVYTWGLHAESLGRTNISDSPKLHHQRRNSSPQLVSGMLPEKGGGFAVAVDASGSHTAVVCGNGALFTWGTTDGNNNLGHEGVRWQPNPKRVPGVHRAIDVAVAKEHTILLIGTSFPSISKNRSLLSLGNLAAYKVAEYVDLFNVIPILMMAERAQVRTEEILCSSD